MEPAQLPQGLGDGGISVFRQKYSPRAACIYSLFQLFCPDDHVGYGQIGHIAALGYSTFLFSVHTRWYYTHFFGIVNKNISIFLYLGVSTKKPPLSVGIFAGGVFPAGVTG